MAYKLNPIVKTVLGNRKDKVYNMLMIQEQLKLFLKTMESTFNSGGMKNLPLLNMFRIFGRFFIS